MRQLNETKQYSKALSLFDRQLRKQQSTSLIINQALKACIHLNNFDRGKVIHQQLSSFLLNNPFIRTNLIRLYSNTMHSKKRYSSNLFF